MQKDAGHDRSRYLESSGPWFNEIKGFREGPCVKVQGELEAGL